MSSEKDEKVEKIFEFWKWCMNWPRSRFTPERRLKINARFRDGYTTEDIIQGICGCSGSAFHMGDNPSNTRYDDLTLICRNGSKLEGFMNKTTKEKTVETYRKFLRESAEKGPDEKRPGDFPKLVYSKGE